MGKPFKDDLDGVITFSSGVCLKYWRDFNLNADMAEIKPTTFYGWSELRKRVRVFGILSSFIVKIIDILDTTSVLSFMTSMPSSTGPRSSPLYTQMRTWDDLFS